MMSRNSAERDVRRWFSRRRRRKTVQHDANALRLRLESLEPRYMLSGFTSSLDDNPHDVSVMS